MSVNKSAWKLRDWIDKSKIDYEYLSTNTHDKALDILYEN